MKLDLLAIAPHPDDAELTCGGTLLKMAEMGYRTGVLDLTRGEMGTRGTPEQRRREAAAASRVLRLSFRDNLGIPDTAVDASRDNVLAVARKIRELRPRTVILPYWEGRHPDHYRAAQLGYEGCFLAGFKKLAIAGQPYRPFKILYAAAYDRRVRPTFVVDISRQFQARRRAIQCYTSQFRPPRKEKELKVHIPLDQLENEMALIARWYGQMVGVQYGEPFVVKEVMQVDDVVDLPVRSV